MHLRALGVTLDEVRFDVTLAGKVAGRPIQVDALLVRHQPRHAVAIEIKHYPDHLVSVKEMRAFVTTLKLLPVNAGAFVTPRGYQVGAVETAKHFGIELFLFTEITEEQAHKEFAEEFPEAAGKRPYWRLADLRGNSELLVGRATLPPHSIPE